MGVRGLTSYIARNSEKYLKPHELHDCNLVIDGDSLSSNLYKWTCTNSAFAGDYDHYYRCIVKFFESLEQCNITPYVLLDGGYLSKKLSTVKQRLRDKISTVKHINTISGMQLFPLMMREVFVEALKDIGVKVMRCIFEADDEVAILARKLNCPVLSFDSDFFIHNVQYIPMDTIKFNKVQKRKAPRKNRRKPSIKPENFKAYYYMECSIYSMKTLIKQLPDNQMLPLLATLLGNDYINNIVFRKFYKNLSLKNIGKRNPLQHRKIIGILRWLRNETLETAITKVLERVRKQDRDCIAKKLYEAMAGYTRVESQAYSFFDLDEECINTADCSGEEDEEDTEGDEGSSNDDFSEYEEDDDEDDSLEDDDLSEYEGDEDDDHEGEHNDKNTTEDENEDIEDDESVVSNEISKSKYNVDSIDTERKNAQALSHWIHDKYLDAEMPRYFVDLLHLKIYINSPQIENFLLKDANEIAMSILEYIFTLLHYPQPAEFKYLTRVVRISNVHYKTISSIPAELLPTAFDSYCNRNYDAFKYIFNDFSNVENIFQFIHTLPENYQLLMLSIIFWATKSKLVTAAHIHSIFISFFTLYEADGRNLPVIRDPLIFQKKFNTILKNIDDERKKHNKPQQPDENQVEPSSNNTQCKYSIKDLHKLLNKTESISLQNNVLQHFQFSDKIRKKHTEYSSTIIHCFSEFQSVVFHINALNALLNHPFQAIRVAKMFNGTFIYNMYVNLFSRPNILHYVKLYMFKNCPHFYNLYERLFDEISIFVNCLNVFNKNANKRRKAKINKKKRQNEAKAKQLQKEIVSQDQCNSSEVEEDKDDFNDINNKFSCLVLKS